MAITLKSRPLPREFVFNGSRIPDPDPQMSIDQVRDLLTPSYPEIATATYLRHSVQSPLIGAMCTNDMALRCTVAKIADTLT
jgi:PRTRC genetic system protein C